MSMYTLEFGILHRDCVVNELSRKYPNVKIVCLGGIVLDPDLSDGHTAEEILSVESSNETEILDSIRFLKEHDQIAETSIIEKTTGKTIVRLLASTVPVTGYCSEAVRKNRCYPLGLEIQMGGVEQWIVGSYEPSQLDALLEQLTTMGEIKYKNISKANWSELLN
jgi:hypothetical protein